MTKRDWAFLAVGILAVVIIVIALISVRSCRQTPPEPPPNGDATPIAPTPTPVKPTVTPTAKRTATSYVSVSINAVPWAEVFIKPPGTKRFVKPETKFFKIRPEPNGTDSNVTPIRGELRVPADTAIKLIYEGKEKTFPYESWQATKSISHDFLEQ